MLRASLSAAKVVQRPLLRMGAKTTSAYARVHGVSASATRLPMVQSLSWTHKVAAYSTEPSNATIESETQATPPVDEKPVSTEKVTGAAETHKFKTETAKLLDIVANSLYSEKEVFIRELVSNAADALEKLRHVRLTAGEGAMLSPAEQSSDLEIKLYVDPEAKTFTIQDTGIGMNLEELNQNLGTIARSGSKAFVEEASNSDAPASSAKDKIIGQFGVGFYSSFMVGSEVKVYTRSAKEGSIGYCWTSSGLGSYEVAECEGVAVGTKIVLHLRDTCLDFADKANVEEIVKKYSNFVGFPILLNGEKVNTINAIWSLDKSSITDEQHREFYRYIANAWDDPQYILHYKTDAPLQISSLLYVPEVHMEGATMQRMEPGVSLYSRKVMIQAKSAALLPEWLRFIKGVVDSEDIPLNLSRELLQDGALIKKLRRVLTSRIIKWLGDEAKRDPERYLSFYRNYSTFIKEGVCTDDAHKHAIAKLLRYETSTTEAGKVSSLAEYLERQPEGTDGSKTIYFYCVPNRQFAEASPYFEAFKRKDIEVLFLYDSRDEFVINSLREFDGAKLLGIESSEGADKASQTTGSKGEEEAEAAAEGKVTPLSTEEADEFKTWVIQTLGMRVKSVEISQRLHSHPCAIMDPESAVYRSMMRMMAGADKGNAVPQAPVILEVNPKHPIIRGLFDMRLQRPEVAKDIAAQLVDNALIAAGTLDDPRSMLDRLNHLLEALVVPIEPTTPKA